MRVQRSASNERRIAVEDEDRAFITLQLRLRLLDGVAGAFLLCLVSDDHIATAERDLDLIAALADHHYALVRAECVDPVEQMQQQRPAGDRVQHLVGVGAHPRALPRGEDHDCKTALISHRCEQWHGAKWER